MSSVLAHGGNARLDTIASVESPEHVVFEYRIAGPARRGAASLVDLALRVVIGAIVVLLIGVGDLHLDRIGGWSTGLGAVVLFVIEWGYFVVSEMLMSGQSPGKRVFRLRVVKEAGHPINFMDSLLRNLLRAADFLPSLYAVGLVVMGFDARFRRLGDLVAGTMVVVEERTRIADKIRLRPPPTDDELAAIPGTARLRPDEREALELFVRRLGRLGALRADELAGIVLPRFADRLPPQAERAPARWLSVLFWRDAQARAGGSEGRR